MARRAPSVSPRQSQRDRQGEARWWQMPAVIAAIIAGLAAILVAMIGL
jgi:hypothetical protein